ncbi:hypothetical protein J2S78_002046 [Salibacterium salarium]|uniref:hypothetical protein n=1 Tax=Salibacterium salarium TaxID=284579 RepID=UPI00277D85E7|nr:hypothetical protein [Salibacterium salarium]MDQ0299626.1 hypothetical protein [Salibacterium salarium]
MADHEIKSPREFDDELREIETSDPVHPDTTNPIHEKLINNDAYLKEKVDEIPERHTENIGYGVHGGLDVLESETPDMDVHVQSGVVYMPDGTRYQFESTETITVNDADYTNDRIDIIYVSEARDIEYEYGELSSDPEKPDLPSGAVELAEIYVAAEDTEIEQGDITDSRKMKGNLADLEEKTNAHISDNASDDVHGLLELYNERVVDHNLDVSAPPYGYYIRWENGLQICFREAVPNLSENTSAFPYPSNFSGLPNGSSWGIKGSLATSEHIDTFADGFIYVRGDNWQFRSNTNTTNDPEGSTITLFAVGEW